MTSAHVSVERLDAAALDPQLAQAAADIWRAEMAVSAPDAMPPSAEGLRLGFRHGHDDEASDGLWVARTPDGTPVGFAALEVSRWANPDLALIGCVVPPSAWGTGVGTALLDAQLDEARTLGRRTLLTFGSRDSHAHEFLSAHGFTGMQDSAQRRLDLRRLDYGHIADLAAEAASHARDYDIVRLVGPTPEEMLPGLTDLFEAINDAPLDDLELAPESFPVERIRRYDAAMRGRRQVVYRLLARHRATGTWAGHTIVCVDENRPGYAVQEDTTVLGEHRGHRIGLWLKASMVLWLKEARPELTAIDTWNSVSNTHMIAVNEALGCQVCQLGVALQRTL